jgi:putative DNA double-strand break repair rad50 ATPase (fragment)
MILNQLIKEKYQFRRRNMETNELQVVEFKIKKIVPAKIESNIEELENFMAGVKEKYRGWIVTEDEIKFAAEERTKLNKLEKILSEERKRIQKEANTDIEKLIEKLKIAEKETKALSNSIAEQIKEFEEKEWETKQEEISEIIDNVFRENPELKLYITENSKWKNKGMTLNKIETELEDQFNFLSKKYNFILGQLKSVNEEIENKLSFKDIQYLMKCEFDEIMKTLVNKKNEIKATEENIKKRAEEEKQRALEEVELKKQKELEELERKKEQEKQEAVAKAAEEKASEPKSENADKKGTYICIKVSGLSEEATNDLLSVIRKHELKYEKKEVK